MKLKVNKDKCTIIENEIWNVGDYNVQTVQVELSDDFDGLVNKVRYFIEDKCYDMLIENNIAQIPYEATKEEGPIEIGVYGFDVDTDILVQSTRPVVKYISSGTYTGDPDNTQPLTPTDKEQMETQIQQNSDDIDELDGRITINTNNISNLQQTKADKTQVNVLSTQVQANTTQIGQNKADITALNNRVDQIPIVTKTSQLTNDSGFITKDVNNLTNYTLKTNTGSLIDLEIDTTDYIVTLSLKNQDGTVISTDSIDLPLESVVVSGRYDNNTKKVILTLENGSEVDFSVADLVSGLQTELNSSNKLNADYVDDTNSGNKFVTTSEKQTWNGKANISDIPTKTSQLTNDSNYVTNTDYANTSTGGVIKVSNANATGVSSIGTLFPSVLSYLQYTAGGDWMFIGKGTLENVITGKGLIDSSSDITGNASTSTTLKSFNYSRKGTNNTWAKVATASFVGAWEEKHAYLFVKGTHNTNFKQNGIISIDAVGNAIKSKVKTYSAQFISASTDLNVENFYIEYQDGDANTDATINFWVKNTTNAYASWQFKILQNAGWTIKSADTSVATLPTQDFTGKNAELSNVSLKAINDKNGNDITTTYVKNTDYANNNTAGVIKLNASGYGTSVDPSGSLRALVKTYEQYESSNSYYMIGKGTLENVITGKELNLKQLSTYDATKTQVLKNINGTLTWVNE